MAGELVEGSRCVGRVKFMVPILKSRVVLDRGTRWLFFFVVSSNRVNGGLKHTLYSLRRRGNARRGEIISASMCRISAPGYIVKGYAETRFQSPLREMLGLSSRFGWACLSDTLVLSILLRHARHGS